MCLPGGPPVAVARDGRHKLLARPTGSLAPVGYGDPMPLFRVPALIVLVVCVVGYSRADERQPTWASPAPVLGFASYYAGAEAAEGPPLTTAPGCQTVAESCDAC